MKIGIGIITYNRPKHLELCVSQIKKHTKGPYELVIWDDSLDRKGIAYGSNSLLHDLKDCDYIFLFNDDCFPIKDNWTDYFINSGYKHSCYMDKNYEPKFNHDGITSYGLSSGVFMFMAKEVIEKVGYYNSAYDKYGFEHAAYSHRVWKAGLSPHRFVCLNNTRDYLCALDHSECKNIYGIDHVSSISQDERMEQRKKNDPIFIKETTENIIYYGFEP